MTRTPLPGSKTERVLALAKQGLSAPEIKLVMGFKHIQSVDNPCRRYGITLAPAVYPSRTKGTLVIHQNKETKHRYAHVPASILRAIGAQDDGSVSFGVLSGMIIITRTENPQ